MASAHLADWTGPEIVEECNEDYKVYDSRKTEAYKKYALVRPEANRDW